MAKTKSRTTGLPVPAKRDPDARKYRSRSEREADQNRLVLIASGIIGGVIVLILAGALLIQGVILPNQPVASVNGQTVSTQDFVRQVTFERWQTGQLLAQVINTYGQQFGQQYMTQILSDQSNPYGQMYQELSQPTAMGQKVLDDMVNNILVKQYADAHNIKLDDNDINQQINQSFGFDPSPKTSTPTTTPTITPTALVSATPTSTPTITPVPSQTATPSPSPFPTGIPTATPGPTQRKDQFDKNLSNYYAAAGKATGLTTDQLRQVFLQDALNNKVKELVAGKPQTQQMEVKARHILLAATNDPQAAAVLQALQNGTSFSNLARADSIDPGSKDQGGELGWAPQGQYVTEFDAAVWNDKNKVGDVVGPIKTQDGLHIIQIEGREMRTLTDAQATQVQDKKFTDWLTQQGSDTTKVQKFDNWFDVVPSKPTITDLGLPDLSSQGGLPGGIPGLPGQ